MFFILVCSRKNIFNKTDKNLHWLLNYLQINGGCIMNWLLLAAAIAFEVLATSSLKTSEGFTRLMPSMMVVFGYGAAFYCLSLTLKSIPIGVAYAAWSGLGPGLVSCWFQWLPGSFMGKK